MGSCCRIVLLIITLCFTLFLLWCDVSHGKTIYDDIDNVVFVNNYDGDTVTVNIPGWNPIIGEWMPIRVAGVDTPERRAKCKNEKIMALIVKRFVYDELSKANEISIIQPIRGKYFRIVGDIKYDGKLLSKELLMRQYAYPYEGGKKENPWCTNE